MLGGIYATAAVSLVALGFSIATFVVIWRRNEPSNTSPIGGKDGARGARLGKHTHSHSANRTVGEATS